MTVENADTDALFTAYRRAPPHRNRRTLMLAVAAVLAGVLTWLIRPSPQVHRVVTRFGIKHLRNGMSRGDVGKLLGNPVISSTSEGAECAAYGTPSLQVASFTLYETCFKNGKLVRLTEKQYTASQVDPGLMPVEAPN